MTLMPEFRRQLLEAAANRPHEHGRRHSRLGLPCFGLTRPRSRLGAPIAATASILIVVAVVAVALTLGPAHRRAGTRGGQRDEGVPSVATARAQLLGELGALRRGHASKLTVHLRLPPSVAQLQIDRSLVRTVQIRGYKVMLIPVSHAVRGSASSRRTTDLVVNVQGPNVRSGFPAIDNGSFTIGNPVSPAAIARYGTIIIMYVSGPLNRAVVIVPDGVTRVQLSRFMPDRSSSSGQLAAIAPASASVHDNVAVIALPDVTTTSLHQTQQTVRGDGGLFSSHHCRVNAALYFVPVSARMTWWRKTDTGSEAHATTVQTSLNGYSTTLLPPAPCRRSPNR